MSDFRVGESTLGTDTLEYPGVPPATPPAPAPFTGGDQSPVPARWTYLAYDLVTGRFLGTIPCRTVTFSSQLNQAGSFAAVIDMGDPRVQRAGVAAVTMPSRTAVMIDRGGVLVGGFWLTLRKYSQATRQCAISGPGLWAYFGRRRIGTNITWANLDQLTAVQQLIASVQTVTGGDVGVAVAGTGTSGVGVSQTILASQRLQVDQVVSQLASSNVGFDYMLDVGYDSSMAPVRTLTLSYPRRGRVAGTTGLVFNLSSKSCLGYVWSEDGSTQATTIYGQGNGLGSQKLQSTAAATGLIAGGYPLLEDLWVLSLEQNQALLDRRTQARLAAYQQPVTLPQFSWAVDDVPQIGSYLIGDDARIIVAPDEWFPQGLDQFWRITGQQVTVGDQGVATAVITLGIPPTF